MNKKVIFIIIFIIILLAGVFLIFFNKPKEEENEILPEEEIAVSQERKTMVSLYFRNKINNELEPEIRLIDVKELINNPYTTILELLIEGPKKENLEKLIPEGTEVLNVKLEGENLILDFSKEFIENQEQDEVKEKQIIESIVKTMTELTEVDSIKILVEGEENRGFADGKVKFDTNFTRED